jgi:hypothetical protein
MVIILSENYRLSLPTASPNSVRASSLVTSGHVISQPTASVKIYWSKKNPSLLS